MLRKHRHGRVGGGRWGRRRGCVWGRIFSIVGSRPVAAGPGAAFNAPLGVSQVLQVTRIPVQTLDVSLLVVHWAVRRQGVGAGRTRLHTGGGRGTSSSRATASALLTDEEGQARWSAGSGRGWGLCAWTVQCCKEDEIESWLSNTTGAFSLLGTKAIQDRCVECFYKYKHTQDPKLCKLHQ